MIVSFGRGQTMERTIRNWKRYTATKYGIVWQRDFFDHRLRSPSDFYGKEDYILKKSGSRRVGCNGVGMAFRVEGGMI